MEVKNSLYPDKAQIEGFLEPGPEGPICMVNLLKFRDKAEYEDGRDTELTGREAYEIYSDGVQKLLAGQGGYIGFYGDVERLMLGEVGDLWDAVGLAMYPSRQAMFEMMQSEGMQAISEHRSAGLEGQLNIETASLSGAWLDR